MGSQRLVLPSAARTATPAAVELDAGWLDGEQDVRVVVDLTAFVTAASLTPKIEVYDQLTGKWVAVATGTAITAVSTVGLFAQGLAGRFRVSVTHGNANSHTYSVSAHLSGRAP